VQKLFETKAQKYTLSSLNHPWTYLLGL